MTETIGRHHSAGCRADAVAVTDSGTGVHGAVHVHGVVVLDAEKLDCYRLAVRCRFQPVVAGLVAGLGYNLRDQFERAALSVVLNIAEGAGRRSRRERRRFYQIARGSAAECGALLDVLAARRLASGTQVGDAKNTVVRLVQMLSRLEQRLG
ncbi:MAG: four helix bundle protein [Vicinamibacteria bacterium]|nr:four helix bundle protein [Vicinamibacteria bacterium]